MPRASAGKRKATKDTSNSKSKKLKTKEKENNKSEDEELEEKCASAEETVKDVNDEKKEEEEVPLVKAENEETTIDTKKKICANGKEWNLKIVSWNVNGIRAWSEHGGLDYLKKEEPDIFCCQETKCDKDKIPLKCELHNYHRYWLSGDKAGYSGVGLMSKVKPIKVTYGLNDKKFDTEGRVITAEYEKFYLINSYIPNSGRGLPRLPFRVEWEAAFLKYMKDLDTKKPVIWCGDLNVAHNRIDLKNPDSNAKTAGFTKEERECFSKLLSEGFIDSFRHLYPNKEGAYTYWSYFNSARENNVGWRLDYFVLSERLKSQLADNSMRPEQKCSDHCPIVLQILF